MKIRVLGCYGSEYPGRLTSCFMINNSLVIDAGAMTSSLTLREQAKIDYILLSHGHLDHILDIPFLADNVIGSRKDPVEILGTSSVIKILMSNILNNRIWPDFTRIPTANNPVLTVRTIKPRVPFTINGLQITAIPVNHTVPTCGFIIQEKGGPSIIYSGDTGPTSEIWIAANKLKKLGAFFIEVSFPNRLQSRADVSKHITPRMLDRELVKIKMGRKAPVFLYHMKPHFLSEIQKDVKALKRPNLEILKMGKRINI